MSMDPQGFALCPPHFSFGGLRIDTPARNRTETYRRDVAFFKANPLRRIYIRLADYLEFDLGSDNLGQWLQLPQLYVLVTQLSSGVHQTSPVYRGKAFFEEVTTDSETAMIVAEMAFRGGIDLASYELCKALNGKSAGTVTVSEVVH